MKYFQRENRIFSTVNNRLTTGNVFLINRSDVNVYYTVKAELKLLKIFSRNEIIEFSSNP